MKIAICLMVIVMMAMNVQARQYGFGAKVFKPRPSKLVVRTEGRCVREVMKKGETMVKAGISAKKIESVGKAVGYAMAGGAAVVAAHSMTSESRAKGKGIDDWNKRMEEEFVKLPQEEQKELMKDVIGKNSYDKPSTFVNRGGFWGGRFPRSVGDNKRRGEGRCRSPTLGRSNKWTESEKSYHGWKWLLGRGFTVSDKDVAESESIICTDYMFDRPVPDLGSLQTMAELKRELACLEDYKTREIVLDPICSIIRN